MCITNRGEHHPWRSTGPGPVPVTPGANALTLAQEDTAGPSMPQCRRHSGQRSRETRMERRQAARVASQHGAPTGEVATAPAGERAVPEPQFPHDMRNAVMAYASSGSTDVAACEGHPGRHLLAARSLTATTNDESYHGSASELPPATSHGYVEWDFSGVPDPVISSGSLTPRTTGSATPSTPAPGATTPRVSAFLWSSTTSRMARTRQELAMEKPPSTRELDHSGAWGQVRPHLTGEGRQHQRAASPSART
jgi:hypothetical protein